MHLTLSEVDFVDEVSHDVVDETVRGLTRLLPSLDLPALTVGPPVGMDSAVVLKAGPRHQLQGLQEVLGAHIATSVGPRTVQRADQEFLPHVSLGYANRSVTAAEVQAVTTSYSEVSAELPVQDLILAEVTRNRTHYEWTVRAAVGQASAVAQQASGTPA